MKQHPGQKMKFALLCSALVLMSVSARAQETVPTAPPAPAASEMPVLSQPGSVPGADSSQSQGTEGQWDANSASALDRSLKAHIATAPPSVKPEDLKTLLFTAWQYALLLEAKTYINTRPPSSSELNGNGQTPTGPREISLGGISFVNAKSWTVWLNSQRIKPDAIPKEVMDIKVSEDHVDLKWFDASTNLIFPIRLRPHQRFNLDDRIFLPGTGT